MLEAQYGDFSAGLHGKAYAARVPRWKLGLLGHWHLTGDSRAVDVGTRQQRCIAALALRGPRSRANLASLLWPDSSEAHASGSLRTCLFEISHRLPALVRSRAGVIELDDVDVDVDVVNELLHEIESTQDAASAAEAVDTLTAAELLPGRRQHHAERHRLRPIGRAASV